MDDVEGKVIGPIPSEDGQAAQTTVTFNLGSEGWNLMPDIAKDIHKIADIDGVNVYIAGAGGQAVDSAEAFEGLDSTLLLAALRRGDPAAAVHLPQPGALDPADLLRGRRRPDVARSG